MKRPKLENVIREILHTGAAFPEQRLFRVVAYGLTRDGEGWSVNNPFCLGENITFGHVLEIARGRWEVFKINYMPKARVSDIEDVGDFDGDFELEVDCTPFIQISLCKPE